MEEQEQQNVVNEEQQDINQVEPTPVSSPPSHKKLIIGIVAVFVLVAGVAGAYFIIQPEAQIVDDMKPVTSADKTESESVVSGLETTDAPIEQSTPEELSENEKVKKNALSTIQELSRSYSKDADYVYFKGEIIDGIDIDTFVLLEPGYMGYGLDKNVVYYEDNILTGADPDTFEIITPLDRLAKDNKNVYIYGNKIENAHAASFQRIQCLNERIVPPTIFRSTFAIDNNTVYLVITRKVTPFLSADKLTFGVSDSCLGFDKNNIYDTNGNVLNVDRKSFEFLPWGYAKDINNIYDLWFGPFDGVSDLIILKDDPNTFIPPERKRGFLLQGI